MSKCSCGRKLEVKTIRYPYCEDCCYCEEDEIETIREITVSSYSPRTRDCVCECHREENSLCPHCLHSPTRCCAPSSTHWNSNLACADNTYSTLKNWFRRFDWNNKGFLNTIDLANLLQYLGVALNDAGVRGLLSRADVDHDGNLCFPEFLKMWQDAARYKDEFLADTGCWEMLEIIRHHHLFPHVAPDCNLILETTEVIENESELLSCTCGEEEQIKVFHRYDTKRDTENMSQREKENTYRAQNDEKLPIFSSNRSSKHHSVRTMFPTDESHAGSFEQSNNITDSRQASPRNQQDPEL